MFFGILIESVSKTFELRGMKNRSPQKNLPVHRHAQTRLEIFSTLLNRSSLVVLKIDYKKKKIRQRDKHAGFQKLNLEKLLFRSSDVR